MKAFSLNCMYFSGIHAGIQTAHCHDELALKFFLNYHLYDDLYIMEQKVNYIDWLDNHKVTVVKNGGYAINISDAKHFLEKNSDINHYPWTFFKESVAAANGIMTNVTIILPEKVYNKLPPFECDFDTRLYHMFVNKPNMV